MKIENKRSSFTLLLVAILSIIPVQAAADSAATLKTAQGEVTARKDQSSPWLNAAMGQELDFGAGIKTAALSRAAVVFNNGVLLRLNELSLVELSPAAATTQAPLKIGSGIAYFFSRDVREFPEIETPIVSASIRGTEFVVALRGNEATISVLHGVVEAHNAQGSVLLRDGEAAVTVKGQAPVKQIMVKPLDAVQWALYYPAVLSVSDYPEFLSGTTADEKSAFVAIERGELGAAQATFAGKSPLHAIGRSLIAYRFGNAANALAEISALNEKSTASLSLYKAGLYLSLGQVEKAKSSLALAETLTPSSKPELQETLRAAIQSQRAIIAVVENNIEEAQKLTSAAVAQAPNSSGALLALSYVQQAKFDLSGALDSVTKALTSSPANPALLARKAELLLGFGKLKATQEVLATSSDSDDSRLLTVKGFSALTRNEVDNAKSLFVRALAKDSESGTPLLGLGLATIRHGDIAGGRALIEQAVAREPSNALFRSYLGKAFFEEEKNGAADKELNIARQLDPLDPTPYLYSAYNKLSDYRPIEALGDIEDSISRNDNRAVYRSRLLLDQDLAVRSIGLSQVYTQLGFEQAAREEAIKSIQQDYTNYSAHLLLAGSYIDQGDKTAQALLSEFFLSQLLAPRDFAIFTGSSGAQQSSFNEYASLFDRNRYRTNIYGGHQSGANRTVGGATNAGTFDNWSYITNYESDYSGGYRSNDYARLNTGFLRLQYQPTIDTSLSTSTVFTQQKTGDDDISFDQLGTDPDLDNSLNSFIEQIGFRKQFDPSLLWIAQGLYSHSRNAINDREVDKDFILTVTQNDNPIFFGPTSVLTDRRDRKMFDTYRLDTQVIKQTEDFTLVTGIGATGSQINFSDNGVVNPAEETFKKPIFELNSEVEKSELLGRAYAYSTLHAAKSVDINLGGSFVHLKYNNIFLAPYQDNNRQIDRFNPKVGLSTYPTSSTVVRAAYFENLGAISLSEIGDIEPTLVGGFNQNTLDVPGVRSKNYGVGVSQKFAKSTYAGSEFLVRDLDREVNLGLDGILANLTAGELTRSQDSKTFSFAAQERTTRTYLSQIFTDQIAGTFKHTWSSLDDSRINQDGPTAANRETHELGFDLKYFDHSGLSLGGEVAWRTQHLSGYGQQLPYTSDGTRDFWLLNAGAGYQLPERRGTVALMVRNILDKEFRYVPTDLSGDILPVRSVVLSFSTTF